MWGFGLNSPTSTCTGEEFDGVQSKFNEIFKEKTKLLCLTRDIEQVQGQHFQEHVGRGYSRPRMWAQYTGNHSGICLMFDKEKLNNAIRDCLGVETIHNGPVKYGRYSLKNHFAFNGINFDTIKRDGINEVAQKHLDSYFEELFLEKTDDWKDECEYRWVLFSKEEEEYIHIDYRDALVAIILGVDFPTDQHPKVEAYCEKFKVDVAKMYWSNGNPDIHPVYNVEHGDNFFFT